MNTLDKVYDLTIDIKNIDVKYNSYAKFFDDDRETSVIRIKLLNDKTPIDLEGCTVEAEFILANNTYHDETCKIINTSEGIVELQLCQECLVVGKNTVRLSILKENEIANTPVITYEVKKGLYSDNPNFNDDPLTPVLSQMLLDVKVTKVNQIELQERYEKSLPKIEGKIKEVESLINRVDTAVASGTQDLEVKEARVDKNGKSYAKLGDRLDEVDSQLEHNIRLGYENTLFDNMKDRFESRYVNVKDFGAKGDGITDDTSAIKNAITYCEESQIDLFFPKGNYLVKSTLYVNIEKMSVYGIEGETTIIINDEFIGDVLVYLYAKNGTWNYRDKRIRTLGSMALVNNGCNEVSGIRTSGEINTDYEGHVDRITVKNMMIKNFEVGVLYGSHSYAFIFEKIYTPYCNYCIKSEINQDDSGEIPVFRNCFFADGGNKIDVKCDLMFLNCTFHTIGETTSDIAGITNSNCLLTFNQCHFERIQREEMNTEYYSPLFRLKDNGSKIIISNSRFVVSGGNFIQLKECLVDNSNYGSFEWYSNDCEWYIKRIKFDNNTLIANNKIGCLIKTDGKGLFKFNDINLNFAWDSGQIPLLSDKNNFINDFTFNNSSSPTNVIFISENSKVTTIKVVEANDFSNYGDNVCKITLSNSHYEPTSVIIGASFDIPYNANIVGLKYRLKTSNLSSANFQSKCFRFYDKYNNLIPQIEMTIRNNDFTFFSTINNDSIYEPTDIKTVSKIPYGAVRVEIGIEVVLKANSDGDGIVIFDYIYPFAI